LIYPPGVYSATEELIGLLDLSSFVPRPSKFIYASHMRSEGDGLTESIEEIIRIGKESGIHVHISHIKTSGQKNWHKIDKALLLMRQVPLHSIFDRP
jgi:N-acyl-D-aspartate/D-glutamate deacylase